MVELLEPGWSWCQKEDNRILLTRSPPKPDTHTHTHTHTFYCTSLSTTLSYLLILVLTPQWNHKLIWALWSHPTHVISQSTRIASIPNHCSINICLALDFLEKEYRMLSFSSYLGLYTVGKDTGSLRMCSFSYSDPSHRQLSDPFVPFPLRKGGISETRYYWKSYANIKILKFRTFW